MTNKRPPLVINAVDFSEYANLYGYSVGYEDRVGPNAGQMLDGTEVVDLVARKSSITWKMNDLPGDKFALLLSVCSDEYVAVKFWDPKTNAERIGIFSANVSMAENSGVYRGGEWWYRGIELTLRER